MLQNSELVTHTLSIPPLTNVEAITSFIGRLLSVREVNHQIPVTTQEIDHPIPESKTLLLGECMRFSELLGNLRHRWNQIDVVNAQLSGSTIVIVLQCSGHANEYITLG